MPDFVVLRVQSGDDVTFLKATYGFEVVEYHEG